MNKLTLTLKQYDQLTYCVTRILDSSKDPHQLFHELADEQKIGGATYNICVFGLEDYIKVVKQMRADKLAGKRVSSLYSYPNMNAEQTLTETVLELFKATEAPKNMKLLELEIDYPPENYDPYAGIGPESATKMEIKPENISDHKSLGPQDL